MQPIEHNSSFIDGAYRSAFFPAADGTSELLASAWFTAAMSRKAGSKGSTERSCQPPMLRVLRGRDATGRPGIHDLLVTGENLRSLRGPRRAPSISGAGGVTSSAGRRDTSSSP